MYIKSDVQIKTPHPEVFGNALDGMPQWQMIVCDKQVLLTYQSNFSGINYEQTNTLAGLTGAFILGTSVVVDPYTAFEASEVYSHFPCGRGRVSPLVSSTSWAIDKEDKIAIESMDLSKYEFNELIGKLIEYYQNKKDQANATANN